MRIPIDATGFGPLYHSERLRALTVGDAPIDPSQGGINFLEQCADLLEQYRTALGDIAVLGMAYTARPDQAGSPLEQIMWIVLHRGLGKPADQPYPSRRSAVDR